MSKRDLDSEDHTEEFTVLSWNIGGRASAGDRKRVVSRLVHEHCPLDLMCFQEFPATYYKGKQGGRAFKAYVGIDMESYGVVERKEERSCYNTILYNKERFRYDTKILLYMYDVFDLMEVNRCVYEDIQAAVSSAGRLRREDWEDFERETLRKLQRLFGRKFGDRLLQQCIEYCINKARDEGISYILKRYIPPGSKNPETPEDLLKRRVAMAPLWKKDGFGDPILVISVHSYSKRSGKGATEQFNDLLFEFLDIKDLLFEFLDVLDKTYNPTVLVAGDFNEDITQCQFSDCYHIPKYGLKPIRQCITKGDQYIDFIFNSGRGGWDTVVSALDFEDILERLEGASYYRRLRQITNHPPLLATCTRRLPRGLSPAPP